MGSSSDKGKRSELYHASSTGENEKTTDQYWLVDSAVTIENYGYNSIKLNAPSTEIQVSVQFQGKAGASGYRSINIDKAGWYFGFVALLNNGERVYSDVGSLEYSGGKIQKAH